MTGSRVAALTLTHGRHRHLTSQMTALSRSDLMPDLYVVAAMDDGAVADVVEQAAATAAPARRTQVVPVTGGSGRLPLSRARNAAASAAVASGMSLLVFLDVDCLPSPQLVGRYAQAASAVPLDDPIGPPRPAILSGAVHYLPALRRGQDRYTTSDLTAAPPHPARPVPAPTEVTAADDPLLFWSLSFAISTEDWMTLGGFDEAYEGYGGEDTDFAMRLSAHGGRLLWVGGAPCYHQHHVVEDPPRGHLGDIVDNSNLFHARWGFFPMDGWLTAFATRGLIRRTGSPPRWHLTEAGHSAVRTP